MPRFGYMHGKGFDLVIACISDDDINTTADVFASRFKCQLLRSIFLFFLAKTQECNARLV